VAGPHADDAGPRDPRGATDLDAQRVSGARYGYAFVYDAPGRPARSLGLPDGLVLRLSLSLVLPVAEQ
jgi:hypothetical protein